MKKLLSPYLVIILFIIVSIIRLQNFFACIHDDFYIYLKYADNILAGNGIKFNTNLGYVEGFSSPLYLMIILLIRAVGLTSFKIVPYLGIIFSSLSLFLFWVMIKNWEINKKYKLIAIVFLAFNPIFMFNTTTGMDTALFVFISLWYVVTYLNYRERKNQLMIITISVLLASTRVESIFIFLAILFYHFFYVDKKLLKKEFFIILISYLVPLIFLTILRLYIFNEYFPNTLYAKVGFSTYQILGGLRYAYYSFRVIFGGTASILIISLLFYFYDRNKYSEARLFEIIIIVFITAVILGGGDHFIYARYFDVIIPFLLLIIMIGITKLYRIIPTNVSLLIAVVSWLLISFYWVKGEVYLDNFTFMISNEQQGLPIRNSKKTEIFGNDNRSAQYTFYLMGKKLNEIGSPNESIACVPIGAISYFSKMNVYDMVGIVDKKISHTEFDPNYTKTWRPGHDKGEGNYILSLKPDYIQIADFLTREQTPNPYERSLQYKSINEIWCSKEFHKNYYYFPLVLENGWVYNLYKRKNND